MRRNAKENVSASLRHACLYDAERRGTGVAGQKRGKVGKMELWVEGGQVKTESCDLPVVDPAGHRPRAG